jgi:hypothetical protein
MLHTNLATLLFCVNLRWRKKFAKNNNHNITPPPDSPHTEDDLSHFSWKRPFELSPNGEPQIYVDGTSRRDVIQVPIR